MAKKIQISDKEVAQVKERYEKNRMICWFCRESIPFDDLDPDYPVETNPNNAAFGYCYCKSCANKLREVLIR